MNTLGHVFRKWPSELSKKHYLEKVSATRFQNVGKPYKTNGNMVSQNAKKRVAKTRIKPVEFLYFFSPESKMNPEIIKKHYLEKVSATQFRNVEIPYNTCRILSFAKCKNALQKPL